MPYIRIDDSFLGENEEVLVNDTEINYLDIVLDKNNKRYILNMFFKHRGNKLLFTEIKNAESVDKIIMAFAALPYFSILNRGDGLKIVNQLNIAEAYLLPLSEKDKEEIQKINPNINSNLILSFSSPMMHYRREEGEEIHDFNMDGLQYISIPIERSKAQVFLPIVFTEMPLNEKLPNEFKAPRLEEKEIQEDKPTTH